MTNANPYIPTDPNPQYVLAGYGTTRADLDSLVGKVVDLLASGDGVEAGFKTTEFWLTVLAVGCDVAAPYIGLTLSPDERMLTATGLVITYGALRTWRKNGGPARVWGDVLKRLAELRQAVAG